MSLDTSIKGPDEPPSAKFANAYAELHAIAARMRPAAGQIPDVDAIEPLVKRANVLAAHCQQRIEAVRKLIGEQPAS